MNDSRLIRVAQKLLGAHTVRPLWIHLRNSVPGFNGLAAHRDLYGCPQDERFCLSTWIALGRYGVEEGCLFYVAKSHEQEGVAGGAVDCFKASRQVPMPVEAGDILCHHWRTVHGSHANKSCQRRVALMACYQSV